MSVQITKQDNFIKINVNENTTFREFDRCIDEYDDSFKSKIYDLVLLFDKDTSYVDFDKGCYTSLLEN